MAKNSWHDWNEDKLLELKEKGTIKGYKVVSKKEEKPKSKRAKYSNDKVEYDGHLFDSKKEYKRYRELLLLLKAGKIGYLNLQVPYELNEGGTHSLKYVADFVYTDAVTGEKVVEDTKGFRTAVYKKKRRLMKKVHNIIIKET